MDQPSNHWRQMFERGRQEPSPGPNTAPSAPVPASPSYDDGHRMAAPAIPPLSSPFEEAAMALAQDADVYRPWIVQRGTRPVMMLHLRRFDVRSGLWAGWVVAYPALAAVEYVGDSLVSLDFGARHFVLEGRDLRELVHHLQAGTVLCVQEFCPKLWPGPEMGPFITAIRNLKDASSAK